jgi:hypothetical protein
MGKRPCFFDFCTSRRWVVSFTPWPLYRQGKSPRYPLNRRFGGLQIRSERQLRSENSYTNWDSNSDLLVVQPVASSCTNINKYEKYGGNNLKKESVPVREIIEIGLSSTSLWNYVKVKKHISFQANLECKKRFCCQVPFREKFTNAD